ncbi:MAG: hypothetical protein JSS49_03480 [Planctomycetes bacterium]|nr:hypothetical protein [Planctomycetota bacterium]
MSEIPEQNDQPADSAPLSTPIVGSGLVSLVAVVLGVFPIALGIGFTLQTPVAPPATLTAAEEPPPPEIPNKIQTPDRHLAGPDRSKGDELLRDGRYEAALHLYRSLGNPDSLQVPPELALRIALCEEGLGLWDESLATYRSVASSNHPILVTLAIFGQSRVWLKLNDFDTAEPLLRSILLQSADRHCHPSEMVAEVTLAYAVTLAEMNLAQFTSTPTAGLMPVGNQLEWSIGETLKWADSKPPNSAPVEPELVVQSPEVPPPAEESLAPADVVTGKEAFARVLHVVAHRQPLSQVVSRMVQECGLQLQWSDAVRDRATARNLSLNMNELPLSILLTAICEEIGCQWTFQHLTKTITITDNATQRELREVSATALTGAMTAFPDHRLTRSAKFAVAQLSAADGQIEEMAQGYSSLIDRTTSTLTVRAAFNAALAFHQLGDLRRTCESLEVVIHGAPGNELYTQSLILYGRTLMDLGDYREAAFQLKRAAGSRHLPEDQARAAVFLAMAQILGGRPHEAAQSLFEHRMQFQDRSVRSAAALMNSIARWQTSSGVSRTREASFLYRSVAAVEADSDWLGLPGQFLLGQAMNDVGLEDQMVELYSRLLNQGVARVMEQQMKLALADYWHDHDQIDAAKTTWASLYAQDGIVARTAGMRLAELALEQHLPGQCLELCRALQKCEDTPREELLKLAGRAYEQADLPLLAAQCYAGKWPLP